ncbi:MAG: 4a-hydroxytetrahydrobiopterin dehydratase [Planctomycetes bacterium]|nr:4a-hydroxytetrahydrobiopterin dehydratase [Planctomycetota bacterium]
MKLSEQSVRDLPRKVSAILPEEIEAYLAQLDGWSVDVEDRVSKSFRFKNFAEALEFVNKVGGIAESENHHPDVFFTWGKAMIAFRTHDSNAITIKDFILAAKIDELAF